MVDIKGLSHWYGKRQVLHDVSLNVADAEILVVMGSSGGGKTTLLKCVSGLVPILHGDVRINGVSMKSEPEAARSHLGMVFQYAALFDYLNVQENVLFGVRRQRRLGVKEAQQIVDEQLAAVGLSGAATLMPNELSGGMRKRVGLARALAMQPSLLLYDEPTSGLDPVTAYAIDQLIVETRDRTGATSIVVSHDVSSVLRVADRIAFLAEGRLLFLGTPDEFKASKNPVIDDLVRKARQERFLAESHTQ